MSYNNLNNKILSATKWSALTEIMSKLITPITSMVLARLLTPEAYGVVATFSIIIAFADIFADAGFQKYLIQCEITDTDEKDKYVNVAFWSNMLLSIVLWGIIIVFSQQLASLVGSPGLGNVLVVSCAGIPLNAFSSIQMALLKREFDFKTLFWRRIVSILVPILITIPLAVYLRSYWALVLGNLAVNFANAFFLIIKSNWKPHFYFKFSILKEMFSFCSWSFVDSILVWATVYADIFVISRLLDSYYLGLYRTSISIVGQIVSLITATVLPVILPSLARLQDNIPEMRRILLKFQKVTGLVIIPVGVGIFVFRDFITNVLLGSQWVETSDFIGLWGLMEAFTIIFARFCSPVFPAIGKPRVSVIVQLSHVVVLLPAVIFAGSFGYEALYITRSLIRIELVIVNMIAVYVLIKQSPWRMIYNILPQLISASIMGIFGYMLLQISKSTIISFLWIFICVIVYFVSLYLIFPSDREFIKENISRILRQR